LFFEGTEGRKKPRVGSKREEERGRRITNATGRRPMSPKGDQREKGFLKKTQGQLRERVGAGKKVSRDGKA